MSKIDWENLSVVEEWTPRDPGDANAADREKDSIQCLSTLILKAFRRHQLARARQIKRDHNASEEAVGG